jgi:hypothetical protein
MTKREYPELARRLAVAVASYRSGVKSMDYFARTYVRDDVADFWHQLARTIMDAMNEGGETAREVSKLIH